MGVPKSVRIAAIVSQAVLILWGLLQLLLGMFQKELMMSLSNMSKSDLEAVGKINLWAVYALTAAALVFTAANFLMCMGKCRVAPLVASAVTTGLLPFVATYLFSIQSDRYLDRYMEGVHGELYDIYTVLTTLQVYNTLANLLSRLLYAGAIITIAAAAIYAYAKKRVTEYQSIERQDYAPPYNIN